MPLTRTAPWAAGHATNAVTKPQEPARAGRSSSSNRDRWTHQRRTRVVRGADDRVQHQMHAPTHTLQHRRRRALLLQQRPPYTRARRTRAHVKHRRRSGRLQQQHRGAYHSARRRPVYSGLESTPRRTRLEAERECGA